MADISTKTMGCDLGDKYSRVCVLDGAGEVVATERIQTKKKAMRKYFGASEHLSGLDSGQPVRVVIEVGTHSRWVAVLLKKLGHEVVVANPRALGLIYKSRKKNDRLDAERLARLGRVDVKLLSPIQHRGMGVQKDLVKIRTRDQLVKSRTDMVNHVRGLVKSFGERVPTCSTESFAKRVTETISEELRAGLEPLLSCLRLLTAKIKEYDQEIRRLCKQVYPETGALVQVAGVGPLTALTLVLTLEDPRRFAKSRHVGPFIGLTPRQNQTGDSDPQLRITKAGDPMLRRLLVNCAHYILGPFGPDTDLRRWGLRIAERGGNNAKKRAIIATARKLAVLLHRLWVTGEEYQPTGYADPIREAA